MSVIGMNSGPHRKSPVTNQQITIDKLKKLKSQYKKEIDNYKEGNRMNKVTNKLLSDSTKNYFKMLFQQLN